MGLHSGLVRYCISKAPTSRDLFGQIAALAHLAWHGVILVPRFYMTVSAVLSHCATYASPSLRPFSDCLPRPRSHCVRASYAILARFKGKACTSYYRANNRGRKPAIKRSAAPIFRGSGQFCSLLQNKLT
jgi:hypothetical protein